MTQPTPRPTVGILYICTGAYSVFWPEFYTTFREKFLPECSKTFFVFTDSDSLSGEENGDVRRFHQRALPWPQSTLRRFDTFLQAENDLAQQDYLFFANANLSCREVVSAREFLPRPERGETLTLVQQPGFYNKKPLFFSYERRTCSTACIPYNCGKAYVSGGLNGGTSAAFLALCHELSRRTEQDWQRGVVALWHDESQLNRYAAELPETAYRLLSPAYWYPQGWQLPFDAKIIVRDKSRWIDVTAVKGTPARRGFVARKWEAFCENWLPYLFFARDALLHKKLLPGGGACATINRSIPSPHTPDGANFNP